MTFFMRWKRLAVLWLICMTASGQSFRDDFTSATLDPAWSVQPGIGTYSLQANPGYLRYVFAGGTSNYDGNATWVYRSFSGTQWTLETKVTYSMPAGSGRQHNLRVFLGDLSQRNVNEIRWVRDRDIDRDRVIVDVFEAGIGASVFTQNTSSPDTHFVRIIRQGQTLSVEMSANGTSFTRVAERTFTGTLSDMATAS